MSSYDYVVIMLYGTGAAGAQLMPLASSWRARLPNTRFAAPALRCIISTNGTGGIRAVPRMVAANAQRTARCEEFGEIRGRRRRPFLGQ
jgi:predicted esterase